jgi:hypothetical protein
MGTMNLKRLQKISHRLNRDKTEVAQEFVSGLKAALAARGHRADLSLATDARSTLGSFRASIAFDPQLGHPTDKDVVTVTAQEYPNHDINWELAEVDSEAGIVLIQLEPSTEVIPVESISKIPPDFKSIGTGLYKRAIDETANEIWTLKRTDDGLALYRSPDDIEVTADKDALKAGDIANTPYGPGRILRFDDVGNAFVQIGNSQRLVAAKELGMYSIEKEKKKLSDYYSEAYGDPDFAKALVEDYADRKKK